MPVISTSDEIRELLQQARSIAVVGLSDRPGRDSFRIAHYLLSAGYRILPVNPTIPTVLGLTSFPDLDNIGESVDIVDVFRRPEYLPEIVEAAIRIRAGAVWTQLGIVHQEAIDRAAGAGITVVVDRCIMVEHRRLVASPRS
jgi:predicted CoA-binding protein